MKPARVIFAVAPFASVLLACAAARGATISAYRDRPDAWFTTDEGRAILDHVRGWQTPTGGWWKSYDVTTPPPADHAALHDGRSIFDNDATTTELRLLARSVRLTRDGRDRAAFERGLAMTFAAQYANGGWPQEYPVPARGYAGQITFNDDAMTRVLALIKDIADAKADFAWLDDATRRRAADAFARGIDCVLACQVKIDGTPTVWCAQHDAQTLAPAKARSYELPSLSGSESAGIVMLLMSIEQPDDRVKSAIRSAVRWFERNKIVGVRVETRTTDGERDVVMIDDPQSADPLWARFYDLDTGKPFYCGRDGVKRTTLAEIERERRAGYAWLGTWGSRVLKAYPAWAKRNNIEE